MKIRLVWVGKTRDKNWKALQDEYIRRLSHFVQFQIAEVKDAGPGEGKEIEGKRILQILNQKTFVVVLDTAGKQLSSHELAAEIEGWQLRGIKEIVFIIGGADGIALDVGQKADFSLSLSFLTFTHEMARVILLEQLYRAFTIIRGFPYQK